MPNVYAVSSMPRYTALGRPLAKFALVVAVAAMGAMPSSRAVSTGRAADGYVAENERAMSLMMEAMMARSSGDPDRDFVSMMVAHHQGAIDMAKVELAHGRNPALRQMAQHIVDTQGHEIDTMRRALDQ